MEHSRIHARGLLVVLLLALGVKLKVALDRRDLKVLVGLLLRVDSRLSGRLVDGLHVRLRSHGCGDLLGDELGPTVLWQRWRRPSLRNLQRRAGVQLQAECSLGEAPLARDSRLLRAL